MADRVVPIALSQVAFSDYLSVSKELLGRSVTCGVDSCPAKLSDIARYLASLAEFKLGRTSDVQSNLRRPGLWLRHFSLSFMVLSSTSTISFLAEATSLDVLSASAEDEGRVAILSGTLANWRDAVIMCCSPDVPKRLRELFNIMKRAFGQLGLDDLWFEYRAKDLQDKTFYLEYDP